MTKEKESEWKMNVTVPLDFSQWMHMQDLSSFINHFHDFLENPRDTYKISIIMTSGFTRLYWILTNMFMKAQT